MVLVMKTRQEMTSHSRITTDKTEVFYFCFSFALNRQCRSQTRRSGGALQNMLSHNSRQNLRPILSKYKVKAQLSQQKKEQYFGPIRCNRKRYFWLQCRINDEVTIQRTNFFQKGVSPGLAWPSHTTQLTRSVKELFILFSHSGELALTIGL